MNDSILEPVQSYFDQYAAKHQQLTEQYFDELVARSGVSAEKNAALMAERSKAVDKFNKADGNVRRLKVGRAVLISVAVLLIIVGLITLVALLQSELQWVGILVACLGVAAAAALIALVCTVFNKRIRQGNDVAQKHKKEIADIEKKAMRQMKPLNDLYDWHIPDNLIYQTVPQIQLDKYFDEDKLDYFQRHCTLGVHDSDSSAVCVKSGNSNGRPFLLARFLRHTTVSRTFTGSRVVTWTETQTDSQGHSRTVTCTETLFASVVKPVPSYHHATYLFFGCDAAPKLHFSRQPTVPHGADDKKIDNLIKKGEKALEKKTRAAVSEGGNFNRLANSEFEVLFAADNRDDEVQFRLMFTPLAQQNMVRLLRSDKPYGDDFCFHKLGVVNVISSQHSAALDIDADPDRFVHYDLAQARKNFVEFNCEYFRSLYFDFAPLFCIPLYTQDTPSESFGECTKPGNIGDWEAEAVANHLNKAAMAHPSTDTEVILKAQCMPNDHGASVQITAHSFAALPQMDYVPVFCRNGHTYEVPVPWTLYQPLERKTTLFMQPCELSRRQFASQRAKGETFVGGITAKFEQ